MVRVTAAVIERGGQVLIAKRRSGDRLAGFWEFPGGKVEPGEDPRDCLVRELHEEFGVTAAVGELLVSHVHHYPHVAIELLSYRAAHLAGAFELRDHDEVRWVSPEEMGEYAFAPADLPTVAFLRTGSTSPAGDPREDSRSPTRSGGEPVGNEPAAAERTGGSQPPSRATALPASGCPAPRRFHRAPNR